MSELEIRDLRDLPQHAAGVAGWIYEAFGYMFADVSREAWTAWFAGAEPQVCTTFVALESGEPVATASLEADDLPARPDLTPWLSSVYVRPEHRARGLGSLLIARVEEEARRRGFGRIHLFTTDREDFYHRRGWQTLQRLELWGHEVAVMEKPL